MKESEMRKLLFLGCGALTSLMVTALPPTATVASAATIAVTAAGQASNAAAADDSKVPVVPAADAPSSVWDAYASAQRAAAENGTLEATMVPTGCTLTQFITSPSAEYVPSLGRDISLDSWTSAFTCPVPSSTTVQTSGLTQTQATPVTPTPACPGPPNGNGVVLAKDALCADIRRVGVNARSEP